MIRLTPKYVAAVVAAGALAVTGVAGAATTTTSGTIHVIGATTTVNGNNKDIVTGAITDYGYDKSVGKTAQKIVLHKGTFVVKGALHFSYKPDLVHCTAIGTGTGSNLKITDGTGAYKNISGTLSVKFAFVSIGGKVNGKCDATGNHDIAGISQLVGTGHVRY